MLTFNVITLFPQLFTEHINNLPFKRAVEKGLINCNLIQLRDYANDKRGTVDDRPFSGGIGMILMIEPIYKALAEINQIGQIDKTKQRVVVLSPRGEKFTQRKAEELSKCEQITFINGRYEGIDARVEEYATDVISIGDYVISGGELASLVIMESITRLLPGVLDKENAIKIESFSGEHENSLEYPQYTRPEEFMGKKVPQVLLSGNHKEIEKWQKENSKQL